MTGEAIVFSCGLAAFIGGFCAGRIFRRTLVASLIAIVSPFPLFWFGVSISDSTAMHHWRLVITGYGGLVAGVIALIGVWVGRVTGQFE